MTVGSVGLAGLGRMGLPMAEHLHDAGFELVVYNRTRSRCDDFAEAHPGVGVATTPAGLGNADVVIVMVADGPAVLEVIDGDGGLAGVMRPGTVVVDMGTTGVHHTALARQALARRSIGLVETPVSGSVAAARAKSLLVMAAGDDHDVDVALPVLDALSGRVIRVGGPGAGAAMKLAVNSVLFGLNEAIAEALVLAERSGIDRLAAYEVFASSAIAAPVVHYRRAVFETPGEVPVTFSIDLATKDLGLVLELARGVGTEMPQTQTALDVLRSAQGAGLGSADMGDVAVHLRERARLSGVGE